MSAKGKDDKNRWRNKTVGFRVSPEEWEQFNKIVALTGLSKQKYLISKLYERDIVVNGNPRVYKALRNELAKALAELQRLNNIDTNSNSELLDIIKQINTTLHGLKDEC